MAARLHDGINDCALTRIPVNSAEAIPSFNGPDLQLVSVFKPLTLAGLVEGCCLVSEGGQTNLQFGRPDFQLEVCD